MLLKVSQFAKQQGICYMTAFNCVLRHVFTQGYTNILKR